MPLYAELAGLRIGDAYPVRVIGALNVSPESFFRGSVVTEPPAITARAVQMVEEGVDAVDIGAMSTAPYLATEISLEEEVRRLKAAVRAVKDAGDVRISVDTTRAKAAEATLKAGAHAVNDVSGLKGDARMARVVRAHDASLIVMARAGSGSRGDPIERIRAAVKASLRIASAAEIPPEKIVVDPGIGFFRARGGGRGFSSQRLLPWYAWDCFVLKHLQQLHDLGRPVCVSVSRKSFIGHVLKLPRPEDRLVGSLSATALAVAHGAHVIRTHDVGATVQAVRMAEAIARASLPSRSTRS